MKYLLLLVSLCVLFSCTFEFSKEEIQEIFRRQEEEKEKNFDKLPPNIVMFTFKKDKKHKIEQFSRILTEFMSTIGVTTNMINVNDRELMGTMPQGKSFDKQVVLDNFSDILEKVEIADFSKN